MLSAYLLYVTAVAAVTEPGYVPAVVPFGHLLPHQLRAVLQVVGLAQLVSWAGFAFVLRLDA